MRLLEMLIRRNSLQMIYERFARNSLKDNLSSTGSYIREIQIRHLVVISYTVSQAFRRSFDGSSYTALCCGTARKAEEYASQKEGTCRHEELHGRRFHRVIQLQDRHNNDKMTAYPLSMYI